MCSGDMLVWVSKNNDPLVFSTSKEIKERDILLYWLVSFPKTTGVSMEVIVTIGVSNLFTSTTSRTSLCTSTNHRGPAFDKFRSAFAALNYCSMAGFSIVCSDGTTAASAWEVPGISGMVDGRV